MIWNRRIGLLASLQYNTNRKKGAKSIEPHEWFNDPAPKKQQTVDEIKGNLMTWAHLVKGK